MFAASKCLDRIDTLAAGEESGHHAPEHPSEDAAELG
jgi:hypothetical protein